VEIIMPSRGGWLLIIELVALDDVEEGEEEWVIAIASESD